MPENPIFKAGSCLRAYRIKEFLRTENIYEIYVADKGDSGELHLLWAIAQEWQDTDLYQKINEQLDALSKLQHPNLLAIQDYGIEDGVLFWTTPSIQGTLLSKALVERSEAQAAAIVLQIAEGLKYLHGQKIVHAGLSPENVILGDDDSVLLMNYGLFPLFNALIQNKIDERMIGFGLNNPYYLAPEQLGSTNSTRSTDLYALGAIYQALLRGANPGDGGSATETLLQRAGQSLLWPEKSKKKISKSSARFLCKLTAALPPERYRSMDDVIKILKKLSRRRKPWIRLSAKQSRELPVRYRNFFGRDIAITILLCLLGYVGWQIHSFNLLPPLVGRWQEMFAIAQPTPAAAAVIKITPTARVMVVTPGTPSPTETMVAPATEVPATAEAIRFPVLLGTPFPQDFSEAMASDGPGISEVARLGYGRFFHAAWSPDGKMLAIASSAGVFVVADSTITQFLNTGTWATSVQFSPDGQLLAVGLQSGDIQLWNVSSWDQGQTLVGHTNRVSRMLFSPNGRQLISASYDLHLIVWDVSNHQIVKKIPAHPLPIRDIDLSADGRILVSGGEDQVIRVWDLGTYQKIGQYTNSAKILAVAISEDGRYLAAGGTDGLVNQWDLQERQVRTNPIQVDNIIWTLDYTHENGLFVGLEGGRTTKVSGISNAFDTAKSGFEQSGVTNELIKEYGGQYEFPYFVTTSAAGNVAVVSWKGEVNGKPLVENGPSFEVFTSLYISPDDRYLLAENQRGTTQFIDLETNQAMIFDRMTIPPGQPFSENSAFFALLEQKQQQASNGRGSPTTITQIVIYSTSDGSEVYRLSPYPDGASVYFSLNDTMLIATTLTQSKGWDLKSMDEILVSGARASGCQVVRSANDGSLFLSHLPVGKLLDMDDLATRICILASRMGNGPAAIAPSKQWIAYLNSSGWLELLSVSDTEFEWRIPLDRRPAFIRISQDESMILTGDDLGNVSAYRMQDGTLLWQKTAHTGNIAGLVISSDGRFIATSSDDGTVRVWAVRPSDIE